MSESAMEFTKSEALTLGVELELQLLSQRDYDLTRAATKQLVLDWIDRGAVELVDLDSRDRTIMHASIGRFADQRPDLADASLLAIADRLGIGEIATFDRKDFSMYRLARNAALELTDFDAPAPLPARRSRRR